MRVATIFMLGASLAGGMFAMDRGETLIAPTRSLIAAMGGLGGGGPARAPIGTVDPLAAYAQAMRRVRDGERAPMPDTYGPEARPAAPPPIVVTLGYATAHDVAAPGGIARVIALHGAAHAPPPASH